ncbi:unnamed protein product [Trichogramma brassicae]|uniref:Uncharacterized protein n=1 Tax=Trichogramma brassicae TaxID=86971 RepID=A0A6H5IRH0_9HYME|nr:unnamed protein product [Trichogramma brassicae]
MSLAASGSFLIIHTDRPRSQILPCTASDRTTALSPGSDATRSKLFHNNQLLHAPVAKRPSMRSTFTPYISRKIDKLSVQSYKCMNCKNVGEREVAKKSLRKGTYTDHGEHRSVHNAVDHLEDDIPRASIMRSALNRASRSVTYVRTKI